MLRYSNDVVRQSRPAHHLWRHAPRNDCCDRQITRQRQRRAHSENRAGQALKLLRGLPRFDGESLVFPSTRTLRPLSDMTLTAVMRRLHFDAVPHGWRSTFRDWAAESTSFPSEVAEKALAHAVKSQVEAAYRRGDLLAKRVDLMQAWADYLAPPDLFTQP